MKLSQMFIGQIVQMRESSDRSSNVPEIGYVVDLALQYDTRILMMSTSSDTIGVLPVVKFVGEDIPRKVLPANMIPYKETKR